MAQIKCSAEEAKAAPKTAPEHTADPPKAKMAGIMNKIDTVEESESGEVFSVSGPGAPPAPRPPPNRTHSNASHRRLRAGSEQQILRFAFCS